MRLISLFLTLIFTVNASASTTFFDTDNYVWNGLGPVTATEMSYVAGATSNLQAQINTLSSTGINSLNGLTSATQTFAFGATGLTPNVSSATSMHTFNFPLASGAGVTSGTISKTDYDNFNGKQSALVNSAGLAAALNDETGTGAAVFGTSPTIASPLLSGTTTAGAIIVTGQVVAGTQNATGSVIAQFATDSTTTGANATLNTSTPSVRLTNSSLTSIETITSPVDGKTVVIENATGNSIVILNNTGATAANRILTGTKANLTLLDEASILVRYDSTESRWMVVGGSGTGGAGGSRLELLTDSSFETGVNEGSCSGCTASQGSNASHLLVTPNNTKYLELAFSASTGTYTVDKSTNSAFEGADDQVGIWIKNTQSGVVFWKRFNGSNVLSQAVSTDGKWHYYEVLGTAGATSIGYQIQATVSITGSIYADESTVAVSKKAAVIAQVSNASDWTSYTPTFGSGYGTPTFVSFRWRRNAQMMEIEGRFTTGTVTGTAGAGGISLPSGYSVDPNWPTDGNGVSILGKWQRSQSDNSTLEHEVIAQNSANSIFPTIQDASRNPLTLSQAVNTFINSTQTMVLRASVPIAGWTATNPNLLIAPDTFSTDSAPLVFKTSAVTSTDPVGTFGTYSFTSSSNTMSACASAPAQSTSSMATNGIQVFTRAFNAASTCASPARVEIQIGKNLKGVSKALFKNTGKSLVGEMEAGMNGASEYGLLFNYYDEASGILYLDAGSARSGSNTAHVLYFVDNSTATSGYAVINAGKNPAITGFDKQIPTDVVTVDTGNGAGSTNTRIRRFSNVRKQSGSCITYADSATLGGSFTINCKGVYSISYCDFNNTAGLNSFGLSIDTPNPTAGVSTLTYATGYRGAVINIPSNSGHCIAFTDSLEIGNVIRAHFDTNPASASPVNQFTITKDTY